MNNNVKLHWKSAIRWLVIANEKSKLLNGKENAKRWRVDKMLQWTWRLVALPFIGCAIFIHRNISFTLQITLSTQLMSVTKNFLHCCAFIIVGFWFSWVCHTIDVYRKVNIQAVLRNKTSILYVLYDGNKNPVSICGNDISVGKIRINQKIRRLVLQHHCLNNVHLQMYENRFDDMASKSFTKV